MKPTPPKTKAQQALEKALCEEVLPWVMPERCRKVTNAIRRAVKAAREEERENTRVSIVPKPRRREGGKK